MLLAEELRRLKCTLAAATGVHLIPQMAIEYLLLMTAILEYQKLPY